MTTAQHVFEEQVRKLATARRQEAEKVERRDKLAATIEDLYPELAQAREELTAAKEEREEADEKLRAAVLFAYRDTGDKPDHPALGIREYKALQYPVSIALKRAIDAKLGSLLELDRKAFETVGPVLWPQFCDWNRKEPKATIARDLSKWAVADGETEPA